MGINRERRWAISVLTIPSLFTEAARNKNIVGNKTASPKYIGQGEAAVITLRSGLKKRKHNSNAVK